jgi:Protein of unknown function (DUF2794)
LTEIGRYYGSFNEFVIDRRLFLLLFRALLAEARPLPSRGDGAIMTLQQRRRRMTYESGEIDPSQSLGGGSPARYSPAPLSHVTFSRRELKRILDLYGRKVAAGEWRDYAIDFFKDRAVFSVFRRSSEMPLYRIEKSPKLARRQGVYSVISATGLIVRRGHELDRVLRAIEPAKLAVVN